MDAQFRKEFPHLPPLIPCLNQVVQDAFHHVRFFRNLYRNKPCIQSLKDFESLPLTDRCLLGQAQSLEELLVDPIFIYGTIYAYNQNHRSFPFQLVESKDEITFRHERIGFCLQKALGLDITEKDANKQERFLILYNQPQAFFSSDLSSELGWECYQNALVLIDACHTGKEIYQKIECFSPDFVFVIATIPVLSPRWIPPCVRGVFTFRQMQPRLQKSKRFPCYDIYTTDEFPYMGIKLPDESFYRYSPWHVYVEKTKHGRLAFTTLVWDNMPWIRYATYDHLLQADEFTFSIRYFGHW